MHRPDRTTTTSTHGRRLAASTLAALALAGGAFTFAGSAEAVTPCTGDDPPPRCLPHPPPPPSAYYTQEATLTPRAVMPVDNGSAEHVTTTVKVRRQYLRATGQEVAEWVVTGYHVENQLALAGWHVTAYEQLYTGSGSWAGNTDAHSMGVTPAWFDPAHATLDASYSTAVQVGFGSALTTFQPVDSFSS